ncbi:GDSL-type esterase/lipase family protein [Acinetobacter baumannii]|nr:GDSL-type esterase/lipase family protein [Acinetobacter baumannii]
MATNWNAVLANITNSADILAILRKVLGLLDGKVDLTKIDEIIADITNMETNVKSALEQVNSALSEFDSESQEAIQQVIAAGLMEGFATEAELLATRPTEPKKYAKAEDTDVIWFWNKPDGSPDGNYWTSTGLSDYSKSRQYVDNKIGESFSNGIYALLKDRLGQSPLWIQDGDLGFTFLELMTMLRVKKQLGLLGIVSDRIIPFHEDDNRNCGLWLEDGLFQCAGVHPNVVGMIKDQLGPISGDGTSNNVTDAAYPIVSDSTSLRQWKAKAAKLKKGKTQQLRLLLTGDSWTEHKTITNEVLTLVRAEFGEAGSGWINLGVENNQLDGISLLRAGTWAYADLNQVASFPNGSGPDGFTLTSTAAGNTVTVSNLSKGDQLTVFFGKTDGTFKYTVNGGLETTITASSTGAAVQTAVIPISGVTEIIFTTLSGTVVLFGMHLRKTTDSGVEVTKMGNGGSTGQDYLKISPTAQKNFVNYLKPDVVVIILGTNDYRYGHSVENFKAGISAMIDGYRTNNPDCGIILIAPAQSNAPAVIPLSEYRDAIYVLAQTKKCEFYNMYDDWNIYAAEDFNGQWDDSYHVSPEGAYRIASKLFKNFLEI